MCLLYILAYLSPLSAGRKGCVCLWDRPERRVGGAAMVTWLCVVRCDGGSDCGEYVGAQAFRLGLSQSLCTGHNHERAKHPDKPLEPWGQSVHIIASKRACIIIKETENTVNGVKRPSFNFLCSSNLPSPPPTTTQKKAIQAQHACLNTPFKIILFFPSYFLVLPLPSHPPFTPPLTWHFASSSTPPPSHPSPLPLS